MFYRQARARSRSLQYDSPAQTPARFRQAGLDLYSGECRTVCHHDHRLKLWDSSGVEITRNVANSRQHQPCRADNNHRLVVDRSRLFPMACVEVYDACPLSTRENICLVEGFAVIFEPSKCVAKSTAIASLGYILNPASFSSTSETCLANSRLSKVSSDAIPVRVQSAHRPWHIAVVSRTVFDERAHFARPQPLPGRHLIPYRRPSLHDLHGFASVPAPDVVSFSPGRPRQHCGDCFA